MVSPTVNTTSRQGSLALSSIGAVASAHSKPAHDGRGCFFNRNPIPYEGLAEVTYAELPPNLRGLRASPFFSRPYVDDLRHFVSGISVTRTSEIGRERIGKWPKRIWRIPT